jgi:PAS domain S-box-containing protein
LTAKMKSTPRGKKVIKSNIPKMSRLPSDRLQDKIEKKLTSQKTKRFEKSASMAKSKSNHQNAVKDSSSNDHKLALEAFENQIAVLNALYKVSEGPVFSVDRKYCYTSFNQQHAQVMKKLFGAEIKLGHDLLEYHTNLVDREQAKLNIDLALKGEESSIEAFSGEDARARRKFEISHYPVKDGKGEIIGVVIKALDVQEHYLIEQQLKQANELLEHVTRGAKVIICAVDMDYHFTYFNSAYQDEMVRLTGKKIKIGMSILDALAGDPKQQKSAQEEWDIVMGGQSTNRTVKLPDSKGNQMVYSVLRAPLKDDHGRLVGAGEVAFDNTNQIEMEETLKESEEKYRLLYENNMDGIFLIAPDGEIFAANKAACKMLQRTEEEICQIGRWGVVDRNDPRVLAAGEERRMTGKFFTEMTCIKADGTHFEAEVSSFIFMDSHGNQRTSMIVHDINERKKRESELARLNRTLRALSNSNQALLSAKDPDDYLQRVCQIIMDDCQYAMVWIGLAEHDENKSIRPVAHAGFEEGYLQTLKLTWSDAPRGRGPTGTTIRTGKVSFCRNMLTDPKFEPWRSEAIKRGYASSLALPMEINGKVIGALTVYSRESDPFTPEEVKLLEELTSDFSHSFSTLQMRVEKENVEDTLLASETRFRRLFEAARDGILILDAESGKITEVNPFLVQLLGYSEKEIIGKKLWELGFLKDIAASREAFDELKKVEYKRYEDLPLESKDGNRMEVEFVSNVYSVDHRKVIQCNIRDISARKKIERAQAWLASFPERNPQPIVEVDIAGNIYYQNPATTKLFPDLVKKGKSHPWLANIDQYFEEIHAGESNISTTEVNFGEKHFLQNITFFPGEKRIRIYGTDITARKKAEATQAWMASFPDKYPWPIVEVDRDGKVFYQNPACRILFPDLEEKGKNHPWLSHLEEYFEEAQSGTSNIPSKEVKVGGTYFLQINNYIMENHRVRIYGTDISSRKRAEAAQAWLASFPDNYPWPIVEVDAEGRVYYQNPACSNMFPDLVEKGKNHPWLNHLDEYFEEAKGGESQIASRQVEISDSHYLQINNYVVEANRVRIYGTDISKRVHAEVNRDRLAAILEATPDMVATFTLEGKMLYLNKAVREMLGLPLNVEASSLKINEHMPDWAIQLIEKEAIPQVLRTGVWAGEAMILDKNGKEVPISQSILAHRESNGEIAFLSTVARDISQRKQIEDALLQSGAELEKKVKQRTQELNESHEKLRQQIEERQRLADSLHDAVNQSLFSAGLIAEVLPRLWERDQEEARISLQDLRRLTRGAQAEMRALLNELRPSMITDNSLDYLLGILAETFSGRTNIPVSLSVPKDVKLPDEVKTVFYRVCQEALNNVVKHANASQVQIRLTQQEGVSDLQISDNGCGFDPNDANVSHYGLGMIRDRMKSIQGQLSVVSKKSKGCMIHILWSDQGTREAE